MTTEQQPGSAEETVAGEWVEPLPAKVPGATFAPAFLALGITFLLFGIVSSYVFSAAGLLVMIWSISKWVGELIQSNRLDETRSGTESSK
jgi:hypothetical protein